MKKQVANTGDYFQRVNENIKLGWSYPQAIVTRMQPAGKYGNVTHYYVFDSGFRKIAEIPSWAGLNGKYTNDIEALKSAKEKYSNQHSIQSFVKLRN